MKPLTYNERVKFEAIKDNVITYMVDKGYNTFHINYEMLCDLVSYAKHYNKNNNSLLRYNDLDSDVWQCEVKDLKTDSLVWIKTTAKKENTIKQLFIYEVLKSQYATKQCFTHFKDNVL